MYIRKTFILLTVNSHRSQIIQNYRYTILHPEFSPALEEVSHPLEREPEADVGEDDDGHGDPHLDVVRGAGGGGGEARDGEHDDDDAVDWHEEEGGKQQLVVLHQSCQRIAKLHIQCPEKALLLVESAYSHCHKQSIATLC